MTICRVVNTELFQSLVLCGWKHEPKEPDIVSWFNRLFVFAERLQGSQDKFAYLYTDTWPLTGIALYIAFASALGRRIIILGWYSGILKRITLAADLPKFRSLL